MKTSFVSWFISVICFLGLCGTGFSHCMRSIDYDQNIGGHIKRAADSQTVELAHEELLVAVNNIEQRNLTSGYTSILYRTPDEDIGFWHRNLRQSLTELESITPQSSPLERSNVLMRLRSTLLDHTEHGERVTDPSGIEIYPHNVLYAALYSITTIGLLLFLLLGFVMHEVEERREWSRGYASYRR